MAWATSQLFGLNGGASGRYWYRWPNGEDMGVQIAYAHPEDITVCNLHISDLAMERTGDRGITYWVTVTNDSTNFAQFYLIGGGVV